MPECKYCRQEIAFLALKDGKYAVVEPEPELVVESEAGMRFYSTEGDTLRARLAWPSDPAEKQIEAMVPHRCSGTGYIR